MQKAIMTKEKAMQLLTIEFTRFNSINTENKKIRELIEMVDDINNDIFTLKLYGKKRYGYKMLKTELNNKVENTKMKIKSICNQNDTLTRNILCILQSYLEQSYLYTYGTEIDI